MRTPEPIPNASDSTISVGELRQRLSDPRLTIVDVRDLPAYNGWRLGGTARGGHSSRDLMSREAAHSFSLD